MSGSTLTIFMDGGTRFTGTFNSTQISGTAVLGLSGTFSLTKQ